MEDTEKAHLIIHSCAVGAAAWSAAWGAVPLYGVTPDTAMLIFICSTMGGLLAHVHGKRFSELKFMAASAAVGQYVAGALIIKAASSAIPIFGSIVNGGVSLVTVEAIGWGMHLILSSNKDISSLTKDEILDFLRRGEELRRTFEKHQQFAWISELPRPVRRRYKALARELTRRETTDERRQEILREIEQLLKPYRPDEGAA